MLKEINFKLETLIFSMIMINNLEQCKMEAIIITMDHTRLMEINKTTQTKWSVRL